MPFQKGQSGNPRGKPKGAQAKATLKREQEIAASGLTPKEYLLSVMRNEGKDEATRLDAAKAVAPYVHPRLTSMALSGDENAPPIIHKIVLIGPE